jgi:hypothetical protein
MTLSITTLSINTLRLMVVLLIFVYECRHAKCHYAECRKLSLYECRYAKCHYAEYLGAKNAACGEYKQNWNNLIFFYQRNFFQNISQMSSVFKG